MEFWLIILVLCHATNSIESVNSPRNNVKLYKTFDEIFGEGWGDEEKPKLSETNESQRIEASSTENLHENSDQNKKNESEKSWDRNDRSEIDLNEVPVELVDSNPQDQKNENPYPKPKKVKRYSDDRKREIVQEYIELKNKFMQEKKHSKNEWKQFYANISKELGVSHKSVFKWKKQFFGINIKKYKDEQKLEKLKEYYEIKLRNPTIKDIDIAADLEISIGTLKYWKSQFKHVPELNMPKSNGPPPF